MENKNGKISTQKLVLSALLTAVVIIFQLIGGIPVGPCNLAIALIPIVIGAIICSPLVGAWLGFVCGATILISGQANYSASKAGLIGFTQTLAKEFGSRNIRVNAVCPGFIQTAMTAELPNIDEYLKAIPMKRLGTVEDIAKVVKFLALDTEYVTGQAIEVAGGLMI